MEQWDEMQQVKGKYPPKYKLGSKGWNPEAQSGVIWTFTVDNKT
jgi:hypothetical protein